MKRYIALLEILNFESFIQNNEPAVIDKLYKTLIKEIKNNFLDWGKELFSKDYTLKIELSFSGKYIIFTSEDSSPLSFFELTKIVQLTIAIAFANGFPVIGCIHCGVILDESNLAKTYDRPREELFRRPGFWETVEHINYASVMGCIISAGALLSFEEARSKKSFTLEDLYRFDIVVTLRDQKNEAELIVINWMADSRMNFSRGFIATYFAKHNKIIDDYTNSVIDNTRAFISTVQSERLN